MILCHGCLNRRTVALVFVALILYSIFFLGGSSSDGVQAQAGDLTPIQSIQSQMSRGDDSAFVDQVVTVEGVVTGVYGDLYFVQDDTIAGDRAWSGIAIYQPGHDLTRGNRVRITGLVSEFHDLTQIEPNYGPDGVTVLTDTVSLPAPVLLTAETAADERWEGVLVRLDNVEAVGPPDQYGEWMARDGSGIIRVDDRGAYLATEAGQSFPSLTGIVDHAFGTYRLIPRSLTDILGESSAVAVAPVNLPEDLVRIYDIQGDGPSTPLEGERINTYGVVTGVGGKFFFLQDPEGDGDATTSDGVMVYLDRRPKVNVGDCVLVVGGKATEYYDKTEISPAGTVQVLAPDVCGDQAIRAVDVPSAGLATDPAGLFEQFEGMLVRVAGFSGVVQGPTKRFSSGEAEIAFIAQDLLAYVDGGRVFQAEADDMTALLYLSNNVGADLPELGWGDLIFSQPDEDGEDFLLGIIDYSYEKYQLVLLPGQNLGYEQRDLIVDAEEPAGEDDFTVCTFNVLGMGSGGDQYRDDAEYADQLHKRALAIAEGLQGCTVIGLQELGTPEDAQNLADLLAAEFGLSYTVTAIEGPGSKDFQFPLTNGLLTRTDRVTVLGAASERGCSALSYGVRYMANSPCERGEYELFNRPPLVVDLAVSGEWGDDYALTVIVNHWKSKGGDETVNVVRRTAQAEHVAGLVQAKLDADPNAHVVVLGDLNDYFQSGPVETLRTGTTPNLRHVYQFLSPADRYTYIFNGGSQVLDHMLMTPNMTSAFAGASPLHINADFPYPAVTDRDSLHHSSDHDPVVMRVRPAGVGWVGGQLGVSGILIQLLDEAGALVAQTETDAQGEFRFWGLTPGSYDLRYLPPQPFAMTAAQVPAPVRTGLGLYFDPPMQHPLGDLILDATLGLPSE